jgi:hypothetical protein
MLLTGNEQPDQLKKSRPRDIAKYKYIEILGRLQRQSRCKRKYSVSIADKVSYSGIDGKTEGIIRDTSIFVWILYPPDAPPRDRD